MGNDKQAVAVFVMDDAGVTPKVTDAIKTL